MTATNSNKTRLRWLIAGVAVFLVMDAATVYFLAFRTPTQTPESTPPATQAQPAQPSQTAETAPFDLTSYYQTPASRLDNITQFPAWKAVPRGPQTFANVPLDIGGLLLLWGEGNANAGIVFPKQVTGVAMNKQFETLYIYHAAFYSSTPGTPVYNVIFHYADNSTATNAVLYESDVLDWYGSDGPTGKRSKLAWSGHAGDNGDGQALRFCLTAMKNPKPGITVSTLDFVSCESRTAGCIMALTPGKSGMMR